MTDAEQIYYFIAYNVKKIGTDKTVTNYIDNDILTDQHPVEWQIKNLSSVKGDTKIIKKLISWQTLSEDEYDRIMALQNEQK